MKISSPANCEPDLHSSVNRRSSSFPQSEEYTEQENLEVCLVMCLTRYLGYKFKCFFASKVFVKRYFLECLR